VVWRNGNKMTETEDYDKSATPTAHASTHQDGGTDEISVAALSGQLADSQPSTWTLVSGKPTTFAPEAHKTSHQDGGSDEISVTGLAGLLVTAQTPEAHKTSHQDGGTDEISVAGLSGTLADAQTPSGHHTSHEPGGSDILAALAPAAHKTSHQDGGTDEISVTGLAGLLVTAQTPAAHKTSHEDGGTDEISVTGLAGLLVTAQTPAAHKTSHQGGGADEISVAGLSGLLADDQHVLDTEVETVITTRQKAKGYRATAQNITADQWNLIDIDTDDYDPDNIVDLTNRRIKPTRAGYYIISAHVVLSDLAYWIAAIHKNGTRMADTAQQYGYGGANTVFAYANGTTDYFDWRVWGNAASSLFVTPASAANYIAVMGPF
jgi:hypothetical protein